MKHWIKTFLANNVLIIIRRIRHLQNKNLPLDQVFSHIYEKKLWGGRGSKKTDFHSGGGSKYNNSKKYENYVNNFINENQIKSIVDLGCGDFRVSKRILKRFNGFYHGCDIHSPLIERNKKKFGSSNVSFSQKNIALDELPRGELCLIREVLQHLDNKNIQKILNKLSVYKFILITECVARDIHKYNLNIVPGHRSRALLKSGLFIEKPPFSIKAKLVLEYQHEDKDVLLRTVCIVNDDNLNPH